MSGFLDSLDQATLPPTDTTAAPAAVAAPAPKGAAAKPTSFLGTLDQATGVDMPANARQLDDWVSASKEPQGLEHIGLPIGSAFLDTFRGVKQLGALASGGIGGVPNMGAYLATKAGNDKQAEQEQPAIDTFKALHPHTYYGLYAPASLLSMAPIGEGAGGAAARGIEAVMPAAPGLMARGAAFAGRTVPTGMAYGAQVPGDTPTNIITGAALGPAGELAGRGVGAGARFAGATADAIRNMTGKLVRPNAAAQGTVRDIISASRVPTPGAPPGGKTLPGMTLTAGGQSLDPGMQSLEQAVRSRAVNGLPNEAVFQSQQRQNTGTIRAALAKIGDIGSVPTDTSTSAHQALEQAADAFSGRETALWQQVPEGNKINMLDATASAKDWWQGLTVSERRLLGSKGLNPVQDLEAIVQEKGPQAPFAELKGWRSVLGQAKRDNGGNVARLLNQLDKTVMGSLGQGKKFNAAEVAVAAPYKAATQFTADLHGKFLTDDVQAMIDADPAKALDRITSTPSTMDSYLKALDGPTTFPAANTQDKIATDAMLQNKQRGVGAVRDYLLQKGVSASSESARGGTEPFLNGQKFQKWVTTNRPVLAKVFTPEELTQMQNAGSSAYRNIASEAANPRMGSNTIQKFMGNKGLSGQMSQADLGGGIVGKSVGTIRDLVLGRYQGATERYLRDALLNPDDPEVAKLLVKPPTQQNITALRARLDMMNQQIPANVRYGLGATGRSLVNPKAALIKAALQAQGQPQQSPP